MSVRIYRFNLMREEKRFWGPVSWFIRWASQWKKKVVDLGSTKHLLKITASLTVKNAPHHSYSQIFRMNHMLRFRVERYTIIYGKRKIHFYYFGNNEKKYLTSHSSRTGRMLLWQIIVCARPAVQLNFERHWHHALLHLLLPPSIYVCSCWRFLPARIQDLPV